MIFIDIPVVAYKTWGIKFYRKTEDDYIRDYEAEEEFEKHSTVCKAYPYSSEHPHIK